MQVLLSPGFLWDAWRRESGVGRPLSGSDFVELLLSEVMLLAGLALARYKQQADWGPNRQMAPPPSLVCYEVRPKKG